MNMRRVGRQDTGLSSSIFSLSLSLGHISHASLLPWRFRRASDFQTERREECGTLRVHVRSVSWRRWRRLRRRGKGRRRAREESQCTGGGGGLGGSEGDGRGGSRRSRGTCSNAPAIDVLVGRTVDGWCSCVLLQYVSRDILLIKRKLTHDLRTESWKLKLVVLFPHSGHSCQCPPLPLLACLLACLRIGKRREERKEGGLRPAFCAGVVGK